MEILFDKMIVIKERKESDSSEFEFEWEQFPLFGRWLFDVVLYQQLQGRLKHILQFRNFPGSEQRKYLFLCLSHDRVRLNAVQKPSSNGLDVVKDKVSVNYVVRRSYFRKLFLLQIRGRTAVVIV